jgi:hypothetical protein
MIQELKIKNFRSFRKEVVFSFEADKSTNMEEVQVISMPDGARLLKFAMVYGANASGKSNLLSAFDFLNDFWLKKSNDSEDGTGVEPFLLDKETPNQPSEFDLKFYVDRRRYWYHLRLDRNAVYSEKLYVYNSQQPTLLFKRNLENNISKILFNHAAVKVSSVAQEKIELDCLKNISFFSAKGNANVDLGEIDKVRNWFKERMLPNIHPFTHMYEYAERELCDNEDLKNHILSFLHKADFNITGINSEIINKPITTDLMRYIESSPIPDAEKENLKKKGTFESIKTSFTHNVTNERGEEEYAFNEYQQSVGTKRMIGVETAIYEAEVKSGFLCIDELESSLHPELMEFLIQKFLENKASQSQLLISTHCLDLLNLVGDLIRKDSVWFTEKDESGSTDLYSLIEFKGLNKMSSILKSYKNGKFGAKPNLK